MTREEQLACLIDRPCNACKFHDKGCFRWKCVFEEEPTDVKPLYKIDTDGHIEEVNKIKEFYNKGYKDGQEALAFHLELCKEEAEPCEDAISRKAVMDYIKDCTIDLGYENGTYMVLDAISKLPSAQPKPREGKWILVYDSDGSRTYEEYYGKTSKCPFCGAVDYESKYCPNCGKRVEKGEVSDDNSML